MNFRIPFFPEPAPGLPGPETSPPALFPPQKNAEPVREPDSGADSAFLSHAATQRKTLHGNDGKKARQLLAQHHEVKHVEKEGVVELGVEVANRKVQNAQPHEHRQIVGDLEVLNRFYSLWITSVHCNF